MARFKQGMSNAMLFCASRMGNVQVIEQLIAGDAGVPAQINVVDNFGRSPLYWAVQVMKIIAVMCALCTVYKFSCLCCSGESF